MNKSLWTAGLWVGLASFVSAGALEHDPYAITKDLFSSNGTPYATGGDYDLAGALGEITAGPVQQQGDWELFPGYFGGGRLGGGQAVKILQARVAPNAPHYDQESLQVGVPLSGPVVIDFSEQIERTSIPSGVQVFLVQNHRGLQMRESVAVTWTLDSSLQQLTVTPENAWQGNSVYEAIINAGVQGLSGYSVDNEALVFFQTVLDPTQENRLSHPTNPGDRASAADVRYPLQLDIPVASIRDYAAVLSTRDPMTSSLRVNPATIAEANRKAEAASAYRVPLALREITAFNSTGDRITTLSKPITLTLGTNGGAASAAAAGRADRIRPDTLALWVLDEEHKLWIKVPSSHVSADGQSVSGSISQLSVYAVMGSPSGVASDVYVFPNPWRPHGPKAGTDAGQTGTEAGGITFATLPSECRIKIYTLAGELVRELTHSDLTGTPARETWDGKTQGGDPAASGAYFWRVESESDSKTGKLLIIR